MQIKFSDKSKVKEKYLRFIKSQEIKGELFKDKINQFEKYYVPLCGMIFQGYSKKKGTRIIGLAGSQGSGKSTISNILKIILKEGFNLNTIFISIDDFYKTLKMRQLMSKKTNNLFLTRGVPGTHDTKILLSCLKKLKDRTFKQFAIPKFDKSNDDRFPRRKWVKIIKKPDVVIFEGWCVGAKPQKKKDLLRPINELERLKDKNLKWRTKVNQELKKNYSKIFNLIDETIFLKAPSFKFVYKWRLLQEKKLKATTKGKKIMIKKELKNFIMFYERITKHMIKSSPKNLKSVITIDDKHRLKSIKFI